MMKAVSAALVKDDRGAGSPAGGASGAGGGGGATGDSSSSKDMVRILLCVRTTITLHDRISRSQYLKHRLY